MKTLEYLNSLQANCKMENEGVSLIMRRSEMPNLIKNLVNQGIGIYAINQKHRTLEQDFISMTMGSKAQIR